MSSHIDNDQLLIHYFQASLTGAALRRNMGLDSANVCTFNDVGEAFVKKYKYIVDMAPDRDQLRSMSQKDKETFKEYAQRWRELVAQINPPLEEKEMIKIFLKTLNSFYYERMISSAPNDYTEMVNIGMRLEEGVREGRLSKDEASSSKKYSGSFSKKKDGETNAVSIGRQRRPHVRKNVRPCQLSYPDFGPENFPPSITRLHSFFMTIPSGNDTIKKRLLLDSLPRPVHVCLLGFVS
jgi:hypothetical protein